MKKRKISGWQGAIPGLIAFGLLLSILLNPTDAYQAALSGLNIFLQSVFPALLPFFIASEIMIGLGVVDFLSVLLNPLMKPLFRCPGSSSFIWVMSITSGYPTGARLTAQFWNQNRITTEEAQRILSFCSTSGPLFMIGAVAIGMMGSPEGGTVILISHYCAAILLGFVFRYYRSQNYRPSGSKEVGRLKGMNYIKDRRYNSGLQQAFDALNRARKNDDRPIGQLMGDGVRSSVNVLLVVGGFIVLFSVVIELLMHTIESPFIKVLVGGLFEVTTGSKLVSELAVSMQTKIACASFVIGWSGLSIHAQSASLLSGTGVRIGLFMLGKLLHGLLAALISIPITRQFYPKVLETSVPPFVVIPLGWKQVLSGSVQLLAVALLLLVALTITARSILWARKKTVMK